MGNVTNKAGNIKHLYYELNKKNDTITFQPSCTKLKTAVITKAQGLSTSSKQQKAIENEG